jgi:regulator of replication initiation timing
MKPEEHTVIIQDILANLTDQAHVSEQLAKLSSDYTTVLKETEDNKTLADAMVADNKKLQQANMNLFLQIGEKPKDPPATFKQEEEKPLQVTDLLDAKGNLK